MYKRLYQLKKSIFALAEYSQPSFWCKLGFNSKLRFFRAE